MAGYRLDYGRAHQVQADGEPYAGAKLRVTENGTTTLVELFADRACTIPAANPITSDSQGRFPVRYIAIAQLLTMALFQASDVGFTSAIWSDDDIEPYLGALTSQRGVPVPWRGVSVDHADAINTAILVASAFGIPYVDLEPAKKYRIADEIAIGNGTTGAISTVNSVILRGVGAEAPLGYRFSGGRVATTLVWVGAEDGRMIDIKGPCQGNAVQNIILDGGGDAGYGLRLLSASWGIYLNVGFTRIKTKNLEFDVQEISDATLNAANVGHAIRSPTDNMFFGTDIDGYTGITAEASVGIYMDGWDAEDNDPCRNTFIGTKIIYNLNHSASAGRAGVGIWHRFCDSNSFIDTWMQSAGTPSSPTTASWLYLEGVSIGGANYPVNNSFSGKLQRGQHGKITWDDAIAPPGGNYMLPIGEVDGEIDYMAGWPESQGVNGQQPESVDGASPGINYISTYGQQVIRDSWRQQLLNSGFERATLGTSFTNSAALSQHLDMWARDKDGAVSDVISQQTLTPGQTGVPFEAEYYLRTVISASSGATSYYHLQRLERLRRFSGRKMTFSVFARVASGSHALNVTATKNYGSGGSPTAPATISARAVDQNQTVTTSWKRFRFRFDITADDPADVYGSTANTSYLQINIALPINTVLTMDLAIPQFEYGLADTPWDRCPAELEEVRCAKYLRKIADPGTIFGYGLVNGADTVVKEIQLDPPMHHAPVLIVTGAAGDFSMQTAAEAGTAACTATPTLNTADTRLAIVSFTKTGHGFTVNTAARLFHSGSGALYLSAPL